MIRPQFKTRLLAAALCAAALLMAAGAYVLALSGRERQVRVLAQRGGPEETTARFFNALCRWEWDTASYHILGEPDLSLDAPPQDELEREIWRAFLQSWSWSMGEGGRSDTVTAWQTVNFSSLQPALLSQGLTEDVQAILARWVDETDDLDAIYESDGQFRAQVVRSALEQAVRDRLSAPESCTAAASVTLHLSYRDGRWQILPEEALWELLSGAGGGET